MSVCMSVFKGYCIVEKIFTNPKKYFFFEIQWWRFWINSSILCVCIFKFCGWLIMILLNDYKTGWIIEFLICIKCNMGAVYFFLVILCMYSYIWHMKLYDMQNWGEFLVSRECLMCWRWSCIVGDGLLIKGGLMCVLFYIFVGLRDV